jgi:hypothetical protein
MSNPARLRPSPQAARQLPPRRHADDQHATKEVSPANRIGQVGFGRWSFPRNTPGDVVSAVMSTPET